MERSYFSVYIIILTDASIYIINYLFIIYIQFIKIYYDDLLYCRAIIMLSTRAAIINIYTFDSV